MVDDQYHIYWCTTMIDLKKHKKTEYFISELVGRNTLLNYALVLLTALLVGLALRWLVFWFLQLYKKRRPSVLKEQLPRCAAETAKDGCRGSIIKHLL